MDKDYYLSVRKVTMRFYEPNGLLQSGSTITRHKGHFYDIPRDPDAMKEFMIGIFEYDADYSEKDTVITFEFGHSKGTNGVSVSLKDYYKYRIKRGHKYSKKALKEMGL